MSKTDKAVYTFADGKQVVYDAIPFPGLTDVNIEELQSKCNLPDSEGAFKQGAGEGIWILVNKETRQKLDEDYTSKPGEVFFGRLLNHSVYFMGMLRWGMVVPFEMRGTRRPVALWSDIRHKNWGADQEELAAILEKLPKE